MQNEHDAESGMGQWRSMIDALQEFDQKACPVGLYAAEEYQTNAEPHPRHAVEWELILRPQMARLGYSAIRPRASDIRQGKFSIVSDRGHGELRFIRVSKVKVRRYGNTFRVDPHHDFVDRWAEAGIETHLRALAKPESFSFHKPEFRLLLLLGFAAEENPFAKELEQLAESTGWPRMPLDFLERSWADPHGRSFTTLGALWVFAGQTKCH